MTASDPHISSQLSREQQQAAAHAAAIFDHNVAVTGELAELRTIATIGGARPQASAPQHLLAATQQRIARAASLAQAEDTAQAKQPMSPLRLWTGMMTVGLVAAACVLAIPVVFHTATSTPSAPATETSTPTVSTSNAADVSTEVDPAIDQLLGEWAALDSRLASNRERLRRLRSNNFNLADQQIAHMRQSLRTQQGADWWP